MVSRQQNNKKEVGSHMRQHIKAAIITLTLIVGFSFVFSPASALAATTGDYSCGSYGGGNYSEGGNCSNNNNIKPPNTGFALLLQPDHAVPLTVSLAAIIAGVTLLVIRRKKRTQ